MGFAPLAIGSGIGATALGSYHAFAAQSQARGSLLSGFGKMVSSSSRFVKVKE